ncbi:MAG: AraC family transcriptional regulator [Rhizomicrobium sp.]
MGDSGVSAGGGYRHPGDIAGAFGQNLATIFHLRESEQIVTPWPGKDAFAVTRLRSDTGIPDRTTSVPSEPALHISVAILPVELRSYELWIDDKAVPVPYIPAFHTSVMDLQSNPICWVGSGFDYVHFHVPRAGLDEIAHDHGVEPIGDYRFVMCENDIVLAQLARFILPLIGSRDWTESLSLDQFSLILGAHVLKTYAGLRAWRAVARGGLAPWQQRRAAEMIGANLDGSIRLAQLAQACGLSVSHFARSFKKSFGMTTHRWLIERRIDRAKGLLIAANLPLADVAMQAGFSDQAAFTRSFHKIVGDSPGRWRRAAARRWFYGPFEKADGSTGTK